MASATPILFVPPPPPATVVAAQQKARDLFSSLACRLPSAPALTLPLHLVEQEQIQGRQLQRLLLQAHVQQRGTGDVGPALKVLQASSCSLFTHRRLQRRTLKTIFGPIDIDRIGYSHRGQPSIHPLDEALQLPARSFSYELQKRLVHAVVQGPLRESIDRILDTRGLTVPMRSLEQILQDDAQDFDAFYAQRPADPSSPAASTLVVAVDCKGIPIVKPPRNQRSVRRTPKPENKRVWASLGKGQAAVVDEVVAEVHRRDPDARLTHVALTDGERALPMLVSQKLNVLLILDLLHVLEKVWKAAHVFHPEGTPDAEIYARPMTHRILEGNVGQVVKGLRQTVTKRKLSGSQAKTLLNVAQYFHRNRDRMRYNDYLAQGLPIASGPVEGACKNLIKDRTERSGMRWTAPMAEAVVQLRALYLSGDFNTYWDFHTFEDQQRLYPPGRWAVVVSSHTQTFSGEPDVGKSACPVRRGESGSHTSCRPLSYSTESLPCLVPATPG